MKNASIEEAENISIIKMDELVGILLMFEMEINVKSEKKSKGIAFKDDVEDDKEQDEEDTNDNLSNSIALLTKRFGKVMGRIDKIIKEQCRDKCQRESSWKHKRLQLSAHKQRRRQNEQKKEYNVIKVKD